MRSALTLLALAGALAACTPESKPAATAPSATPTPQASASTAAPVPMPSTPEVPPQVAELAHIFEFMPAGDGEPTCLIKLDADDQGTADEPVRLAWTDQRCYPNFPGLRKLSRWAPNGDQGLSLTLMDQDGKIIGEFSPVQDGTGVYMRGGVGGKVYEMRTPSW